MRIGTIGGLVLALAMASPAAAQSLESRVRAALAKAGPGVRFGIVVADDRGREILTIAPDDRFIPASNTKMFSTAAAISLLPDMTRPDTEGGASVVLDGKDVVLFGHGDARLSSAPDCVENCLAMLADAVAAKTKRVGDVIGDDTLLIDERWSQGQAWNNIVSRSGTAASALTIDDNELLLNVTPAAAGTPAAVTSLGYYTIDNRLTSAATGPNDIDYARHPGSSVLRLSGSVGAADTVRVGIDDPAHYAAWRLKALLEARGVKVRGQVRARHRVAGDARAAEPAPLLKLTPSPLSADLTHTNKVSQNLHAELFLRRASLKAGDGTVADGMKVVKSMMDSAGVPATAWNLSDGSGMSMYNRLAPRGVVTWLRWTQAQPWGAAWKATLPIAGVDGTVERRFKGTILENRLFAKTGTLNGTNALSGFMLGKSGRTLTFSTFANDVPPGVVATAAVEAALVIVAAEN